MKQLRYESGFTLTELMVVVAVMAILSSIAIPAFGSMSAGNDLNNVQEDVIETLKKARAMAVSRSTFATIAINSANHTMQLGLADGSQPLEIVPLRSNITIAADATLVFGAQGTVTAQAGTTTIDLTSSHYSSLPVRHISVSPTGIVTAAR